jgi:hypothetical protein
MRRAFLSRSSLISLLVVVGSTIGLIVLIQVLPPLGITVALTVGGAAIALLLGVLLKRALGIAPTEVEIRGSTVIVRVKGIDKLAAFRSRLEVPLTHVVSVEALDAELMRQWRFALRNPGSALPGVIMAGTYYKRDERAFWDIRDPDRGIVFRLRDEGYDLLVIEVEDPDATLAVIQEVL